MLKITSFIHLIQTCKFLHATQKLREEEIYKRCLNGIKSDLQDMDLLRPVEAFLLQWNGVIEGNVVDSYLQSLRTQDPITILVPQCSKLTKHANYIQKYINPEKHVLNESSIKIDVYDKYKHKILLTIEKSYNPYTYDDPKYNSPCTNLKKIYCSNLCKFLKDEELKKDTPISDTPISDELHISDELDISDLLNMSDMLESDQGMPKSYQDIPEGYRYMLETYQYMPETYQEILKILLETKDALKK